MGGSWASDGRARPSASPPSCCHSTRLLISLLDSSTNTLRNDNQATLTDRGRSTGPPGGDTGSRRGTWRNRGKDPSGWSLLPRPSSSSSFRHRRPGCPWQSPRRPSARRAGPRTGRAVAPRTATAGGGHVATSLSDPLNCGHRKKFVFCKN